MEQVLKAQEIQTAQKKRSNAKRQVTRIANKLKESLKLEKGQRYDFSKLNKKAIQDDYEALN